MLQFLLKYYGWNWAKKLIFWIISRGFLFMPSDTVRVTPKYFAKRKTLLRYTFMLSFIRIAYVIVKFKIFFKKVFCIDWTSMKLPLLGGFLGSYSPKYCSILLKFWSEIVSNKTNTVWKILQNAFRLKWDMPKVYGLSPSWGPIYCGKTKNIAKNQNSSKTTSLGCITSVICAVE